jgi:hypothetical protein
MTRPINPTEYTTMRLGYPEILEMKCPICGSKVKYIYSNNGKLVHCLQEEIHQIINLYQCTNPNCNLSTIKFNPVPRFDYSGRHFGRDVFDFIAQEFLLFKQKPEQIYLRISKTYPLSISLDTVARICDDILLLKANQIDQKTKDILSKQMLIVMAMDGQDPGKSKFALWLFTDVISGRLLAVRHFKSLDNVKLHKTIEEIKQALDIEVIGFLSDKQGLIVKCMQEFYPDIPHQYCQFHYLNNHWKHLDAMDSGLYMALKAVIGKLYIHKASSSAKVRFEGIGQKSVREVFQSVDAELQKMLRKSGKRLEKLKGIWVYASLREYVEKGWQSYADLNPEFRFSQILKSTLDALTTVLNDTEQQFMDISEGFQYFIRIKGVLSDQNSKKAEKLQTLDLIYKEILDHAIDRGLNQDIDNLKSILVKKNRNYYEILGEWVRLWMSYEPGLFKYYDFPLEVKTNVEQERAFGWEKQLLFARTAKKNVSHMVITRGPYYLRLFYNNPGESTSSPLPYYQEKIVRQLRGELDYWISVSTEGWLSTPLAYDGFNLAQRSYYIEEEGI